MALKIVILLFLALTVTKACDLDWILEDIYDETDSGEDESTEKPEKPGNQNSTPTPTTIPTSPAPTESTSITTRPFPVVPAVADADPGNDSTPSTSSSRAMEGNPIGKRRHRKTHHRRHLIRRVPIQNDDDEQTDSSEGRSFNSEPDQFSLLERYLRLARKNRVQDNESGRAVPLTSASERKNVNEQERSFTIRDFISERHVPFIELPEGRTGSIDLDQNTKEQDQLESEDFIKVLIGPIARKDDQEQVRIVIAPDTVPLAEIPKERMESFEGSVKEEEEPESGDSIKDVEDQGRSFTANDSLDHKDIYIVEMPEGRMENTGLNQNIRKREEHLMKLLITRPKRRNVKKRVPPTIAHLSKSDVKNYVKEYLNKLILRDVEDKMDDSNEYVYIPIPKNVLHKNHVRPSLPKHHKGSHLVSIINREYSYKQPEEPTRSSITETWVYKRKPVKAQHPKNEGMESYVTLMLSQVPPEESKEKIGPSSTTQHLMLHNQNPRRPFLINSNDSDRFLDEPVSEIGNPTISHVNHVKEHILRETIKVNPIDHSEIRNVHEQTRLSIIKSPHVPIELTMENHDLADLDGSSPDDKDHLTANKVLVQQLPLMNSKIHDFHQKYPVPNSNPNQGHRAELQHQNLLFQELPLVDSKINFLQGFYHNAPVSLLNKYGEGHDVQEPNPTDPTKLSAIFVQAQSYPIKYPINNPTIDNKQQAYVGKPTQENNFYVKPQTSEMDMVPANPILQNEAVSGQSYKEPQNQQVPLQDMINKFKGHIPERPMQDAPPVEASTPPVKHAIKNAV